MLTCYIAQAFSASVAGMATESPRLHILLTGRARMVVEDAVRGAARRLAGLRCQQLLLDFSTPEGAALSATLETSGKSPAAFLAELYFADGDGSTRCRSDESTAAFTVPASHVIYVCGARFADRFARKTAGGEILVIHEFLHALGLDENPPTSEQITDAVRTHCGD
jgi:hypothetical protein